MTGILMPVIAIVVLGGFWLFLQFLTKQKEFIERPIHEQEKLKKSAYWIMIAVFSFSIGCQLLINSKTTAWIPWLAIGGYVLVWAVGCYLIWDAYRLGVKKELNSLKKSNGLPYNQPEKFIQSVALTQLAIGISVWGFAIAIPIFKLQIESWTAFFVFIGILRSFVLDFFEKKDSRQ